jgi:hypothetical protein
MLRFSATFPSEVHTFAARRLNAPRLTTDNYIGMLQVLHYPMILLPLRAINCDIRKNGRFFAMEYTATQYDSRQSHSRAKSSLSWWTLFRMNTSIGPNPSRRSTSANPMPGTELGHLGSVVREGRLTLTISLWPVKETEIGLSPALNSKSSFYHPKSLVYHDFLSVVRNSPTGHVASDSIMNAQKPCNLTGPQNDDDHPNEQNLACMWNWGSRRANQTPRTIASHFKTATTFNLVIDQSLVEDLTSALCFPERFQRGLPAAERTKLFQHLFKRSEEFVNAIILRLDERELFESGRPIAHVFSDVVGCISFLRNQAAKEDSQMSSSDEFEDFERLRRLFWWDKLSTSLHPAQYFDYRN